VFEKVLCVFFFLEKGFAIRPRDDELPGFYIINETGIRIEPLNFPFVASYMLRYPYSLNGVPDVRFSRNAYSLLRWISNFCSTSPV
jgi:hypothetical protein